MRFIQTHIVIVENTYFASEREMHVYQPQVKCGTIVPLDSKPRGGMKKAWNALVCALPTTAQVSRGYY